MALDYNDSELISAACNAIIISTRQANSIVGGSPSTSWRVETHVDEDDVNKTFFEISCRLLDGRESSTVTVELPDVIAYGTSSALIDQLVNLYHEVSSKPAPSDRAQEQSQAAPRSYTNAETALFVIMGECVGANIDLVNRYQIVRHNIGPHIWEVALYTSSNATIRRVFDLDVMDNEALHYAIDDMFAELRSFIALNQAHWNDWMKETEV